jgi:outer membrane protein assembly factor BamB
LSATDGHLMARVRVGDEPIQTAPLVVGDLVYVYDVSGEIAAFRIGSIVE